MGRSAVSLNSPVCLKSSLGDEIPCEVINQRAAISIVAQNKELADATLFGC